MSILGEKIKILFAFVRYFFFYSYLLFFVHNINLFSREFLGLLAALEQKTLWRSENKLKTFQKCARGGNTKTQHRRSQNVQRIVIYSIIVLGKVEDNFQTILLTFKLTLILIFVIITFFVVSFFQVSVDQGNRGKRGERRGRRGKRGERERILYWFSQHRNRKIISKLQNFKFKL